MKLPSILIQFQLHVQSAKGSLHYQWINTENISNKLANISIAKKQKTKNKTKKKKKKKKKNRDTNTCGGYGENKFASISVVT